MDVLGSASVPHASIRAWRLEPLPEIRTVRLYCGAMIVVYIEWGRSLSSGVYGSQDVRMRLCA